MGILDDLKQKPPKYTKNITGKVWLTLLIEVDLNGNSKILKSFTKPAKDSNLKFLKKEKQKDDYKQQQNKIAQNIEEEATEEQSESLF